MAPTNADGWTSSAFQFDYPVDMPQIVDTWGFSDNGPDLDIDSDNNNGLSPPDRTFAEEQHEADKSLPGKIITVNGDDSDSDGIPGFADGYDFDSSNANDNQSAGTQFAPVVLDLPASVDLTNAKLKFTYDASDPMSNVIPPGISGSGGYEISAGHLRLWTKDGATARDGRDLADDGDWINTDTEYTAAELGLSNTQRTITVFAEAVAPSAALGDQEVKVELDPGSGELLGADSVRVTSRESTHLFVLGFDAFIPQTLPGSSSTTGWFPEPYSLSNYEFKGDQRHYGQSGTSRLHTLVTIDTFDLGNMTSVIGSAGDDASYRRVIGTTGMGDTMTAVPTHTERVYSNTLPHESMVEAVASAGYPFNAGAPNIDYHIYYDVEVISLNKVQVTLYGDHDAFPEYEAWVSTSVLGGKQYYYDAPASDPGPGFINLNTNVSIPLTQITLTMGTP